MMHPYQDFLAYEFVFVSKKTHSFGYGSGLRRLLVTLAFRRRFTLLVSIVILYSA